MKTTELLNQGLKREVSIEIPGSDLSSTYKKELEKVQKQAKMDGFRPGKAPINLIEKEYGPRIVGQVLEEAAGEALEKFFADSKLKPAYDPEISDYKFESMENGLGFKVSFEIFPEIKLPSTESLNLEIYKVSPTEGDIHRTLENIAKQNVDLTEITDNRASKEGDVLDIDAEGFLEGVAFEGGKLNNHQLKLGSGQFIPGFEDQLIGHKANSDVTVNVTFPEDYHEKSLAGKPTKFEVKINKIQEEMVPEINEAFAEKLGYKNLEDLKQNVKDNIPNYLAEQVDLLNRKIIFDKLELGCDFEIPEKLYNLQLEDLKKAYDNKEIDSEDLKNATEEEREKSFEKIAKRKVKIGMLLLELAEKNKITVTEKDLIKEIEKRAKNFPGAEKYFVEILKKNRQMIEQLRGFVLESKVIDNLKSNSTMNEKELSVEEIEKLIKENDKIID